MWSLWQPGRSGVLTNSVQHSHQPMTICRWPGMAHSGDWGTQCGRFLPVEKKPKDQSRKLINLKLKYLISFYVHGILIFKVLIKSVQTSSVINFIFLWLAFFFLFAQKQHVTVIIGRRDECNCIFSNLFRLKWHNYWWLNAETYNEWPALEEHQHHG